MYVKAARTYKERGLHLRVLELEEQHLQAMLRATLSRSIGRSFVRRQLSTSSAGRPLGRVAKFLGGSIALGAGLGGGYYMLTPKPVLSTNEDEIEEVDALIIGGGIMGAVCIAV